MFRAVFHHPCCKYNDILVFYFLMYFVLEIAITMKFLVDVVWNNLSLRTASTMNFLVDVVWNNLSLRTASTMHNEPLGGCCVEQYVLENCKYNEPLGGCFLEQTVLENCKYNAQ